VQKFSLVNFRERMENFLCTQLTKSAGYLVLLPPFIATKIFQGHGPYPLVPDINDKRSLRVEAIYTLSL